MVTPRDLLITSKNAKGLACLTVYLNLCCGLESDKNFLLNLYESNLRGSESLRRCFAMVFALFEFLYFFDITFEILKSIFKTGPT